MKKAFVFILIPIFFLSTSYGVAVTAHFCKGELEEIGFDVKTCCKKTDKDGCCKTEAELVKVKDNFIKTSFDFYAFQYFLLKENYIYFLPQVLQTSVLYKKGNQDNAPPVPPVPLYIQFSSLII